MGMETITMQTGQSLPSPWVGGLRSNTRKVFSGRYELGHRRVSVSSLLAFGITGVPESIRIFLEGGFIYFSSERSRVDSFYGDVFWLLMIQEMAEYVSSWSGVNGNNCINGGNGGLLVS